jgi:hypothetical protein
VPSEVVIGAGKASVGLEAPNPHATPKTSVPEAAFTACGRGKRSALRKCEARIAEGTIPINKIVNVIRNLIRLLVAFEEDISVNDSIRFP